MSKIEAFWVNATAFEVARVMAGETVEARFRDDNMQGWTTRTLSGWQATGVRSLWHSSDGFVWTRCQVYREPSWYANRPDPGEGYRLLEKFPDEPKLATDDAWQSIEHRWDLVRNDNGIQAGRTWYRRRIEPVEPKFDVGQMVRVVGPNATYAKHWDSEMARHAGTLQTIKYIEEFANPTEIFYGVYGIDSRKFWEDHLEPVEPEPKHYVLRVGDTVENPNGDRIEVVNPGFEQSHYALKVGDTISTPNGQAITITAKGFEVTQ